MTITCPKGCRNRFFKEKAFTPRLFWHWSMLGTKLYKWILAPVAPFHDTPIQPVSVELEIDRCTSFLPAEQLIPLLLTTLLLDKNASSHKKCLFYAEE